MLKRADVPAALQGTPPKWWPESRDVLAFGPFAVEMGGGRRLGSCLQADTEPGCPYSYGCSDGRQVLIACTGEAAVDGDTIRFPMDGRETVVRSLVQSDLDSLLVPDKPDDIVAAAYRAFDW